MSILCTLSGVLGALLIAFVLLRRLVLAPQLRPGQDSSQLQGSTP